MNAVDAALAATLPSIATAEENYHPGVLTLLLLTSSIACHHEGYLGQSDEKDLTAAMHADSIPAWQIDLMRVAVPSIQFETTDEPALNEQQRHSTNPKTAHSDCFELWFAAA
jgi:hypothetical protein